MAADNSSGWGVFWAAVAALAAIAGVVISSYENRRMLDASDAALVQARAEHSAQLEQFAVDNAALQDALRLAARDRQDRAEQFDKQLASARQAAIDQLNQGKAQLAEQQRQWSEEKAHREEALYQQYKPELAPVQCCNYQVALLFFPDTQTITLPFSEKEKGEFSEDYNVGYVAKLVNLGGGPAGDIRADWVVSKIVDTYAGQSRDNIVSETENANWRHNVSFTVPNHIRAGDEVEICHLPRCIGGDSGRIITRVEGSLEVTCYHIFDDGHTSPVSETYTFWMEPNYRDVSADKAAPSHASIHVHIGGAQPATATSATRYAPDEILPAAPLP